MSNEEIELVDVYGPFWWVYMSEDEAFVNYQEYIELPTQSN